MIGVGLRDSVKLDGNLGRLQASRQRHNELVHKLRKLREISCKITIVTNLLSRSPSNVWMSTDREAILFSEKKGSEEFGISRAELDELPHLICRTLRASREIDHTRRMPN